MKEQNRLKNFRDIIEKQRKSRKIDFFALNSNLYAAVKGVVLSQNDLAGLRFSSKEVI